MNFAKEILLTLSRQKLALLHDDLFGLLTPPDSNVQLWRTKVTGTIRTLIELQFIKMNVLMPLGDRTYIICPPGRKWILQNCLSCTCSEEEPASPCPYELVAWGTYMTCRCCKVCRQKCREEVGTP